MRNARWAWRTLAPLAPPGISVVTLNTYAHMMPVDEDRGRLVLDSALGPKRAESILSPAVPQAQANVQVSGRRVGQ